MGRSAARELPRALRWSAWVAAGVLAGAGVGFTFELTRPRVPRVQGGKD